MDRNLKHVRDNAVGAALSIVAGMLLVVIALTGDDEFSVPHGGILLIAALGAAWFSCGLLTALRQRR